MAINLESNYYEDPDELLFRAAWTNDAETFDIAISRGGRLNAHCEAGLTVCGAAAIHGDLEFMRYIISRGANPNELDDYNRTALYTAVEQRNIELVRLLLSHGAHPRFERKSMETSLHESIDRRLPEIATLIISVCGFEDLSIRNFLGYTPLILAVKQGYRHLVTLLIDKGASVTQAAKGTHETPLHFAVESGNIKMVEILMRAGADPGVNDIWGGSPRNYAAKRTDTIGQELSSLLKNSSQ